MCHGVLMYLDDIGPMLASLARVAAPHGAISLLVRNGLAPAMRDGLRGRWPEAARAFDSKDYVNRLGLGAHAHTPQDVDRALHPSPVIFTSPLIGGVLNYSTVAFVRGLRWRRG